MVLHLIRQDLFLRLVAMLKELLDHIVAKDVRHELHSIGKDLPESLIFLITVGRLELLLNEPGAVLITTKFDDVPVDVLFESARRIIHLHEGLPLPSTRSAYWFCYST